MITRIGGGLLCALGVTVIILLGYANFGLKGGPGYDLIHGAAYDPGFALAITVLLSLFTLMLGATFIVPGVSLLTEK